MPDVAQHDESEFEQVFDVEQRTVNLDGLSRFLFTHAERFGVSFIDDRPMFSTELLQLFNFIELWKLMQADMQSPKKRSEQPAVTKDEIEEKVMEAVKKVEQLVGHLEGVEINLVKQFLSAYRRAKRALLNE